MTRLGAGGLWTDVDLPLPPTVSTTTEPGAGPRTAGHDAGDSATWIITQGLYENLVNLGVLTGTRAEVDALVERFNAARRRVDEHGDIEWVDEPYQYELATILDPGATIPASPGAR